MLSDRDVQELLQFQPSSPVLSVYLNTDPTEGNADHHRLILRNLLKPVEMAQDAEAVMRYFELEHDWNGRSVAVFSCAAQGFFKAYALKVPVRSRVRVSDKPHVKPLADLLDSYGGYGVILVDKQGARLFHFHLGELVQQEGFLGDEVRRAKRGGGTQTVGKRGGESGISSYEEQVTERNMKDLTAFADKFFANQHVRRVVVCGSDDNVALFRSQLPKAWQSLIIGACTLSMNANENEVLERILYVGTRVEEERERQLVEGIVTAANKGKAGVLGLQDTLNAQREGRIQNLVIRDGYRAPAYCCQSCGYMSAQPVGRCPFCDGETEQVPDAVETLVRQAMQTNADVDVLHDGQDIKGFDKIGALLRY